MDEKQAFIEAFQADLVSDLAQQLVAIPSRNPPGEEKACAEFIYRTLREWGVEADLVREPDPERPQVVSWVSGSGQGPTFILSGHIDTVQEGDATTWRHPPFEPTLLDGRLYGLGACDMKGSLAVGMAVLKTVHEHAGRLPGTLMFQAAMGEEMAEDGTRTLLNLGFTGDAAVVMEPTDLKIGRATRGVSWHRLTLSSNPLHCGFASPDEPDILSQFSRIQTALSVYHKRISLEQHPLLPSSACRVTRAQAGERHNHLPARGEFTIDRRMLPGECFEQVREELTEILDGVATADGSLVWELTYQRGNEPVELEEDAPLVQVLRKNAVELEGREAESTGMIAGTDVRNFMHDHDIPAVNFGAGDFNVCHKPNEFVGVDDLIRSGRILLGTALDVIGL